MNLSQLNDFLQNVIKVVNQHAKLLKTLNKEMQKRVTVGELDECFGLLNEGLWCDKLLNEIGGTQSERREAVILKI